MARHMYFGYCYKERSQCTRYTRLVSRTSGMTGVAETVVDMEAEVFKSDGQKDLRTHSLCYSIL